ncbi:tRNA uridine(34) 5-carboxymethylaminomethyl synthesis GTPase MnmE [Polynucleobacter sp. QLW-P1DATA-2]|uniref:tRNA uridine-5-carboxymethylaminomethyl(34) synthesis GTPase MnmE n=1 Tax=unclassified Polynucleobacter TaxID=2640945 RepID=UPI0008F892C9|nr:MULTISPECIES: tRNA uridine-5-carboxymethylaminomethyl(34) synthesis GTPase MnmE [unclassified Polynucleobacter]OIN02994.1 tRNA uridine(34) 5-carboxymethylaminomethyl synthesis GTPase MnmE [Polynucleobacter sp. QLW-P1DATA-2]OIN03089.1 tRNA uridine(34) 5-carboxymethylaminomethyl synthesis GTPase MnmE [Polynucleobacter sp. MWH-Tro8-2-5-gr]
MTRKLPIIAVATAPGKAGVGVVRISGQNLSSIARALFQKALLPRQATLLSLRDSGGQLIDQLVAIYFAAPASFTGEDVLELQCHGGPQLLELVIKRCLELGKDDGLVIAEPGEFTLRAYLNNKVDLAQAEAIADLIDAQSEAAVRGAARSLQGVFSDDINALVEEITQLRILVESTLDFPEEEIEFLENAQARERLSAVKTKLQALRDGAKQGKILRDGIQLVLAGAPNVGKSSLLNRLAGEEVAIVTPIAGTTRDRVKESIQIEGVPMHIIDTAGLRQTADEVEAKGIERTWDAIRLADLVIFLTAADAQTETGDLRAQIMGALPSKCPILEVLNKSDLLSKELLVNPEAILISAKKGDGIDLLKQKILEIVGWNGPQEGAIIARRRHLDCIERAAEHIEKSEQFAANGNNSLELFAEELFLAQNHLGQITGKLLPDDLLGKIFSQFCIGK